MKILQNLADHIRFLSEPPESPDFGKEWDDWKASKDAAREDDGR